LQWNADSTLLAILLERLQPTGRAESLIQLWYMMNYHWYLKQEFFFCKDSLEMMFDVEDPMVLHLLSEEGEYVRYEFAWDVYTATNMSEHNHGNVAVIDGGKFQLMRFSSVYAILSCVLFIIVRSAPYDAVPI
jgi:elongator complex protein 1